MENNWASEHLQVIRALMERSAVYRRALAPVMIVSGGIGIAAAMVPCAIKIESNRAFSLFWMSVSLVALLASFLLVRRQALKDTEPFWSPPTRRVTEALLPAFMVGLLTGTLALISGDHLRPAAWLLASGWAVIYGCALHAAGFFMERGIKLFGWLFLLGGCAVFYAQSQWPQLRTSEAAHYIMGTFFGVFHLAYGIYLVFTERRKASL